MEMARLIHASASSLDIPGFQVSSQNPVMYALPLPPRVKSHFSRDPPSGMPNTCAPARRSQPAMIMPADRRSLFLYAICIVTLATSLTSAMPGSSLPLIMPCSSTAFLTMAHTFWVSAACRRLVGRMLDFIRVSLDGWFASGAAGVFSLLDYETWKNGTLEEYRRDGATG